MSPARTVAFCAGLAVGTAGIGAANDSEPASCRDEPALRQLDFWVGDWQVAIGEQIVGRDRIERVLDGCAVVEHWESARGGRGMSLFYLTPDGRKLQQVWVTTGALSSGGTKEKSLVTVAEDGTLVFQGLWWDADGRETLDRTRLTPLSDGRVRQVIELSADAGAHWTTNFDAIYTRMNTTESAEP